MPHARRGWTRNTWLTGFAYAATVILFVAANKTTTSANAIFLENTAPLYMLALGPLVLREPVRGLDLAAICAVAAGAILLLRGSEGAMVSAPNPTVGNILALVSGLTWALTIAGLRRESRQHDLKNVGHDAGMAAVIAGNVVAFAVCLPMALPVREISALNVAAMSYLGIFQVGLAYVFLTRSLKRVPGVETSTLLLIEPVFNPVWTWLLQGERPDAAAVAWGALIILSTLAATAWRARITAGY
jgi:DME family drug/metabolite transporter